MALLYLEENGLTEFDISIDGNTDSFEMAFLNDKGKDLQIVRTSGTGNPLITFQISNDGINWASWEVEGFIFKNPNHLFEFEKTKHTFFRVLWLSNGSTGTFTANFNVI
jgi:hypothetical protein